MSDPANIDQLSHLKAPMALTEFYSMLAEIIDVGTRNGISMNAICARAGVGRSVPVAWSKKPPKTIALLTKMQRALDKMIEEQQQATRQ